MALAPSKLPQDDEFKVAKKPSKPNLRRLYVGNLPQTTTPPLLQDALATHLKLSADAIRVETSTTRRACFVTVDSVPVNDLLKRLEQFALQDGQHQLVFQRERRPNGNSTRRTNNNNNNGQQPKKKKPAFRGWSKPRNPDGNNNNNKQNAALPMAHSFPPSNPQQRCEKQQAKTCSSAHPALEKKDLTTLLADYGEQDLDWKTVQPMVMAPEETKNTATDNNNETINRLGMRGKAPVHVVLYSFGFHYGIPRELRTASTGNSHSTPLPAFDCRFLNEVPPYLAWRDGLSGAVKHAYTRNNNNNNNESNDTEPSARDYSKTVANEIADCLNSAIADGGHGYAAPLTMTIYFGSEQGRHRSVVVAEWVGTALRRRLRQDDQQQFAAPVSVGCYHSRLQRRCVRDKKMNDDDGI